MLKYKFVFFVLMITLVLPHFIKGPDGQPIFDITKDFFDFDLKKWEHQGKKLLSIIQDKTSDSLSNQDDSDASYSNTNNSQTAHIKGQTTVYKWQDAKGNWHFTDNQKEAEYLNKKHGNERTVNVSHINPNQNVIKSIKTKSSNQDNNSNSPAPNTPTMPQMGLTTVPMADIPKLIDQAHEVKALMENRTSALDAAISGKP